MKTGTASGCLVWLLTFALLSVCVCPVAIMAGSITSSTHATFVAGVVGPYLCPAATTPEVHTFATTIVDSETGVAHPATGTEIHCVDAAGANVRTLGASYALAWVGLLSAAALALAAVGAVVLAVPAGAVVGALTRRRA